MTARGCSPNELIGAKMVRQISHKGILLVAVLSLLALSRANVKAQFRVAPVRSIGDKITCHVGGTTYVLTPNKRLIFQTSFAVNYAEVQEVFDKVSEYTDLRSNIYTVPVLEDINVEICPGEVNYVAYNADWLKRFYYETNSAWALYAVIAHEIGHFVLAHDRKAVGSDPKIELEADEYAGEVLAKMGACLSGAQAAFRSRILEQKGDSHPPISQRLVAVKTGWQRFGKECGESEPEAPRIYLKMDIEGEMNSITLASSSTTDSVISATSTATADSSTGSSSISDTMSGNTRRIIVNGDRLDKTFYLDRGKSGEINLWGRRNKLFISLDLRDRVKVNDRGESNQVIYR